MSRLLLMALLLATSTACGPSSEGGSWAENDYPEGPLQCGPDWNCLLVASTRCEPAVARVLTVSGFKGIKRSTSWTIELRPSPEDSCVAEVRRELVSFSIPEQTRTVALAQGKTEKELEALLERLEAGESSNEGDAARCSGPAREITERLMQLREGEAAWSAWKPICSGALVDR